MALRIPTRSPSAAPGLGGKGFGGHVPITVAAGPPTNSPANPVNIISSSADWTFYQIYPKCCVGYANYDPTASTIECTDYSGCVHPGKFNAIGQRSLDFVQK
jgi:hypothetical protein